MKLIWPQMQFTIKTFFSYLCSNQIRHVGIYVQFKAQQTERLYRSRHDKVQLKLLL